MPQYKFPEMSLAQMQYNPSVFQGVTFVPQTPDTNILNQSLAKMEERDRYNRDKSIEATKQISAFKTQAEQLRNTVHGDEESLRIFDEEFNKEIDKVNSYIQSEDYGKALESSYLAPGNLMTNNKIGSLIKANTQYQNWIKDNIDNNNALSTDRKRYYKHKAEQNYNNGFIYDDNDNITGVKDYDPGFSILGNIDFDKAVAYIDKITGDESLDKSDTRGNTTENADGTGKGYQRKDSNVVKEKSIDRLEKSANDYWDMNYQTLMPQAIEEIEEMRFLYDERQNEIDDIDKKLQDATLTPEAKSKLQTRKQQLESINKKIDDSFRTNTGAWVDGDVYFKTKVIQMVGNASYKYVDKSTSFVDSVDSSTSSTKRGSRGGTATGNIVSTMIAGQKVFMVEFADEHGNKFYEQQQIIEQTTPVTPHNAGNSKGGN